MDLMAFKFLYFPKNDTQNYPVVDYNLCLNHLDTQLNEPTNQNLISCLNKERYYKTLGNSKINSQMYLPPLVHVQLFLKNLGSWTYYHQMPS